LHRYVICRLNDYAH